MTIAFISHPDCLLHDPGVDHPDSPARLSVIEAAVAASDLASIIRYETAPRVTREQLLRVHSAAYLDALLQRLPLEGLSTLDADTVMNAHTVSAAVYASGAVVHAVDLLASGQADSAFCNVRPPGHHAEREQAMGFCFFNHVAVGVAHALEHHRIKRVAIIDFDAHRGNGTEAIFQSNKKVLICSLYEELLYPFSISMEQAKHIIRIPLPAGSGGREFRAEMVQHGLEKIERFQPDLTFFSAGFDGHRADPISSLQLTEHDYFWITSQVKERVNKYGQSRFISVLEGGYALDVLGACVVSHLQALRV